MRRQSTDNARKPPYLTAGRVLLIDDDAVYRSEFSEAFADHGIIAVAGGEAALAVLRQPHEIKLIFLDVRLSGQSGIELLPLLRAQAPAAAIVILTGYGSTEVAVAALRGRADDFIEKSFDPEAINRMMEKYCGGRPAATPDSGTAPARIARVKEFLQRNVRKQVTLAEAARLVHISPKHLSRMFREQTGESFIACRIAVKIAAARQMLTGSSESVGAIAFALGYENAESLIRQFRRLTGTTPAAYRQQADGE